MTGEDSSEGSTETTQQQRDDEFLQWLTDEIERRSVEIEEMAPRNSKGEWHKRESDAKVAFNRGLRTAREEYVERCLDRGETDAA